MGSLALLAGLTLVVGPMLNAVSGSFNPSRLMMMQKAAQSAYTGIIKPPSLMNDDELFAIMFKNPVYLLTPEEQNKIENYEEEEDEEEAEGEIDPQDDEDEVEYPDEENRRSLVSFDEDYDDYGEGRGIISTVGAVVKKIGKIGLSMLKQGLAFLKSTFYKFGGKRLLNRAKEYLSKDAFSIEPLSCENTTCSSCAVFNLPFKIKSYKACAEMGFVRTGRRTNFTVGLNVLNKNMFHRDFPVGDLANCIEFDSEPDSEYPIASLVGKVCLQGFEFKIDSKKVVDEDGKPKRKGKFCIAVVFKRWATGFRFCVERTEKKTNFLGKAKETVQNLTGKNKGKRNETQRSRGKLRDKKTGKLVWKVELKRIAAGEQDNQIVGDLPLFKGEAQKRKRDAEVDLAHIANMSQ